MPGVRTWLQPLVGEPGGGKAVATVARADNLNENRRGNPAKMKVHPGMLMKTRRGIIGGVKPVPCLRDRRLGVLLVRPLDVLAFGGIDTDRLTGVYERRHLDDHAGFKFRGFGDIRR